MPPKIPAKTTKLELNARYAVNDRLAATLRRVHQDEVADAVSLCHRQFTMYGPKCGGPDRPVLAMGSCWHRLCPFCNAIRARRATAGLKHILAATRRPKLVTITVRSVRHITPAYFQQWREWFTKLRARAVWKRRVRGGVYSLETTYNPNLKTWHVHLHALVDADFLEQKWLAQTWEEITDGAGFIVDVREARNHPDTLKEVVKYIAKGADFVDDTAPVFEFLAAVKGSRLLGTFGCFYAFETKHLDEPPVPAERFPRCSSCGSTDPGHWENMGPVPLDRVVVVIDPHTDRRYFSIGQLDFDGTV